MMRNLVPRLFALAILSAACSGCAVGYIYERYGGAGPTIVLVGCHTSYEVYESSRDRTLLVRSNVQAGISGAICSDDIPPGAPPEARLRRAVEVYFANNNRPQCKIVDGRSLSLIHAEFNYLCSP